MRGAVAIGLVLALTGATPALAQVKPEMRIHTPEESGYARGFDNLRFGVTQFREPSLVSLFGARGTINLGFDYHVWQGFALGADLQSAFRDGEGETYITSVLPLHLKYRAGFGLPNVPVVPFVTVGGGPALGALAGGSVRPSSFGVGLSGSAGIGVMLQDALAIEVAYNVGQAGGVALQGLQLKLGTAFGTLGGYRPPLKAAAK